MAENVIEKRMKGKIEKKERQLSVKERNKENM